MSGWISIHRKITENWVWEDKPFSKGQAWIDLLMLVNHEDKKFLLGNELMEVKRGSRITSIRQLADRWGWSRHKVDNFLNLLESDNMIIQKRDTKKTVITIVNYSDYQPNTTTKEPLKSQQRATKEPAKDTNNNDNNENNDNKNYIYSPIIEYLNLKTGKSYKATTKKTKDLIKARVNEGFSLDDFKKVIDNKVSSWKGTEWEKYLRPETLFGTKFESYLNEGGNRNGISRTNDTASKKYDTSKFIAK